MRAAQRSLSPSDLSKLNSATNFLLCVSGHDFSRAVKTKKEWGFSPGEFFPLGSRADSNGRQRLNVKFQEVVVHSIENCEADVAKQKHSQEIEWTITIMLD
jgi:hypothetical protein